MICNVHWQSDILSGRFMAAATVAKLHSLPEFRADVDIAQQEVLKTKEAAARSPRQLEAQSAVFGGTVRRWLSSAQV
ncbi:hypothetical protein [Rhizobium sp. PL01]|uniref:hypothetical protein n=1 Tax=Rhizobium sp. PL01 TaxID=3085631 RepID=UPI002980C893|nr:hypothetical protein [Rhizobium sp. PL01]MDW5316155.1 hypothetical protein [Rhizobium sp. PL01]